MKLRAFRIQMYKNIQDSGWVECDPLTVLIGKNESGKTALLRALKKFNPFDPDPYQMESEWPRGQREKRDDQTKVCSVRFETNDEEAGHLADLRRAPIERVRTIEISRDYAGRIEVEIPDDLDVDRLHPNDVDSTFSQLPDPPTDLNEDLTCPRSLYQSLSESDRRDERHGTFPGLLRFRGGGGR